MLESSLSKSSQFGMDLFLQGGPVGVTVMLVLVCMSILTWAIIIERYFFIKKVSKKSEHFIQSFWDAKSLTEFYSNLRSFAPCPAKEVFRAGYNEMIKVVQTQEKSGLPVVVRSFDTVRRALNKTLGSEEFELQSRLNLLGISASAAPFIGLFGTVVGIIRAFQGIAASGATSLSAVAPGISEALVATALGLVAAIPASIFSNLLMAMIRRELMEVEGFGSDFLNILERHFSSGKVEANGD